MGDSPLSPNSRLVEEKHQTWPLLLYTCAYFLPPPFLPSSSVTMGLIGPSSRRSVHQVICPVLNARATV